MAIVGIEIEYSEDLMAQVNKKLEVVDCSKEGRCSDCGQCCGNMLPLNYQEISRIEKYVKKHHIQECKQFAPLNGFRGSMLCPFRDNNAKRCTIYPVRPAICRSFFCGKSREEIVADREEAYRRSSLEVDMRATFFGHSDTQAYLASQK